jgi:hypothetical protein
LSKRLVEIHGVDADFCLAAHAISTEQPVEPEQVEDMDSELTCRDMYNIVVAHEDGYRSPTAA